MVNIKISDLRAGYDLFSDSESYLTDLTDYEVTSVNGGLGPVAIATITLTGASIITVVGAIVLVKAITVVSNVR